MKKRNIAAAVLAAVVAASVPMAGVTNNALSVTASAEEIISGDYTYHVSSDGMAEIRGYDGEDAELVIPNEIDGIKVAYVVMSEPNNTVEKVIIPDFITGIGYEGFSDWSSLKAIEVDENNEYYATKDGVLFNKDMTHLLSYPGGKESTSYTVPDGVTYINSVSGILCPTLKSITLSKDVAHLSVISVDGEQAAFNSNTSLEEINVVKENETYYSIDGVLFNKIDQSIVRYPSAKKGTSYKIPDEIAQINHNAFKDCSSLTEVTIPNSVNSIYYGAFLTCTSLSNIIFEGTEEEWGAIQVVLDASSKNLPDVLSYILPDVQVTFAPVDNTEPNTSESDNPATPGDSDEQTILEVTLKGLDSEKGIEGAALDAALFGESGWTWDDVEKIVFTSDDLFSVEYKAEDGWRVLGDESSLRASNDGIWSTEWTLNTADMAKDEKAAKLIAKDGVIDVSAEIYIKQGAENPDTPDTNPNNNPATGIALAVAPVALAAGIVFVASKKRK